MPGARVLVTGMSGLIGSALRAALAGRYELRALNRGPVEGVPCHRADIADLAAIRPAFTGVDVVVHLAAIARGGAPWDDILHHNIAGTYNVFEAARQAGVKRVIFASSGATVSNCERDLPYSALVAGRYRADNRSGCTRAPTSRPTFVGSLANFRRSIPRRACR